MNEADQAPESSEKGSENLVEAPAVENTAPAAPEVESPAATNLADLVAEDYKSMVESKGFKDVNDVIKSYTNLEKMVGNSIRIPSEDASPEAKKDFLDKLKGIDGVLLKDDENLAVKLGRPETIEGYKLEVSEDLQRDLNPFHDDIETFKQVAFEQGLTDTQATKLLEMQLAMIERQEADLLENRDNAEATLKKTWGEDYDNRMNAAKKVLKIYADKYGDDVSALVNSNAGNNPAFINMLSELSELYTEKGHEGMSGTQFGMTPDIARDKINEKRADRGFMEAYNSVHHPEHKKAVAEMQKLYNIAHGN